MEVPILLDCYLFLVSFFYIEILDSYLFFILSYIII
jgi:hypothetical protein